MATLPDHPQTSSLDSTRQKGTPELVLDFLSAVSKDSEAQKGLSSLIRTVGLWLIVPSVLCVLALCVLVVASYITVRTASPLIGSIMAGGSITVIATATSVRWMKRRAAKELTAFSADDGSGQPENSGSAGR